jgi:hypothetical protein
MNAFADRPDPRCACQICQGLNRVISHDIIELAHQSLVGTKHDRADRTRIFLLCVAGDQRR